MTSDGHASILVVPDEVCGLCDARHNRCNACLVHCRCCRYCDRGRLFCGDVDSRDCLSHGLCLGGGDIVWCSCGDDSWGRGIDILLFDIKQRLRRGEWDPRHRDRCQGLLSGCHPLNGCAGRLRCLRRVDGAQNRAGRCSLVECAFLRLGCRGDKDGPVGAITRWHSHSRGVDSVDEGLGICQGRSRVGR